MEIINEKIRTARKEYECNACIWLNEHLDGNGRTGTGFLFSELRQIIQAKRDGWKILKGQSYRHYTCKYEGELYPTRERPEITAILTKYQLWPEE